MAFRQSRFSKLLRVCETGEAHALAAELQECLPLFETLAPFQVSVCSARHENRRGPLSEAAASIACPLRLDRLSLHRPQRRRAPP